MTKNGPATSTHGAVPNAFADSEHGRRAVILNHAGTKYAPTAHDRDARGDTSVERTAH